GRCQRDRAWPASAGRVAGTPANGGNYGTSPVRDRSARSRRTSFPLLFKAPFRARLSTQNGWRSRNVPQCRGQSPACQAIERRPLRLAPQAIPLNVVTPAFNHKKGEDSQPGRTTHWSSGSSEATTI